ncbi:hypothetical protein Q0Z83_048490 [Actinoplanes sichuanensis]|uniref:Tetratricopeptide repeat protein n=1 Tax=Actinoplanes sichuanensis TaxID=512349 RepID=A0ABW4AQC7_9ACTN|nr:tetratricopeptide repeat protein [Actinoplanes sichuanensis]BEL06658.1 hypothetical protein Q0Z83_048490 [Actinoplanes sichuanensis]
MRIDERIQQAGTTYEQAVFAGDTGGLDGAERGLDAMEADIALARGRLLHARFLSARADRATPVEDPAELALFERAATTYRELGDVRGEGEALFWMGCLHQVVRRDDDVAVPLLERSLQLATRADDKATQAEALRHLGIAAHGAGRLDEARERLEESSRRWRAAGVLPGVAANMIGLAVIATAQGRPADPILDEALVIARSAGAHAVVRQIEEVRAGIQAGA